MMKYGNALPTERTSRFAKGDLVYCDIIQVAAGDWEVAVEGGRLLDLEESNPSWPKVLSIILDPRPTMKVARIYAISLNRCIRSPYDYLFTIEEDQSEHNKKRSGIDNGQTNSKGDEIKKI